jgi:hypothetical protein
VLAVVNGCAPANHTRAADVVNQLGIDNNQARVYLNRLADADRITKVATGAYTSVTSVMSVTPPLTSGFNGAGVTHDSDTEATVMPLRPTGTSPTSGATEAVTDVTVVTPMLDYDPRDAS